MYVAIACRLAACVRLPPHTANASAVPSIILINIFSSLQSNRVTLIDQDSMTGVFCFLHNSP